VVTTDAGVKAQYGSIAAAHELPRNFGGVLKNATAENNAKH